MNIKTKVLATFMGMLALLVIVISVIAVTQSSSTLLEENRHALRSVESTKKHEIEAYFDQLGGLLTSLASQQGTKEAFLAFEKGFYLLSDEIKLDASMLKSKISADLETNYLNHVNYSVPSSAQRRETQAYLPKNINALIAQYIFIVDNKEKLGEKNSLFFNEKYDSAYMRAHKKYHNSFNKFLTAYSLYDIFMVDLKGNLIYTDFKEKDYATNLKEGVYSNTGIAEAYKKALTMKEGEIAFSDFKPYEPSYSSPASFIATPIMIEGKKEGILIFQMPVDIINKTMSFGENYQESGLGESGEAYLVGSDYTMRSNSRFQKEINDPVVKSLGTTIGVWKVKTESTQNVINKVQSNGTHLIKDYRGVSVLSAYDTLNLYSQATWIIVAEIDEEEVMEPAVSLMWSIIIASVVVFIIAVVVSFILINFSLVKPLKELEDKADDLAHGEADLTSRLDIKVEDEIGRVSRHINSFIEKVQTTISEAKQTGSENSSVAEELARTSLQIGQKVEEESTIVNDVSDQGSRLQHSLLDSIDHAKETGEEINSSEATLSKTNNMIVSLTHDINERAQQEIELSNELSRLKDNASEVKAILDVIKDIADQTNLLALNAAIEAARAGEHGRGFAVVADEVRKLAERTQKSLSDIDSTISVIVQAITDASHSISTNASEIEKLSLSANKAQNDISESVDSMRTAVLKVDEIVNGYVQNGESIKSMVHKVESIKSLSSSNARSVEEIASASEHLSNMTVNLNNILETYKS